MFVPRVDNRPYFAPLLIALIAIAWFSLFIWGESPYGRFLSHDELGHVDIGLNAEGVGIALVFVAGWTVMTVAMMLPTSLPLITMFARVVGRRPDHVLLSGLLIAGYIAIWTVFGAAVHTADRAVHAAASDVGWMMLLGGVMAVEKNMPWGRQLSLPLGVVLVFAGIGLLLLGGPADCAHHAGC